MMSVSGIMLTDIEVDWLFAECYAPIDMATEDGKSVTVSVDQLNHS